LSLSPRDGQSSLRTQAFSASQHRRTRAIRRAIHRITRRAGSHSSSHRGNHRKRSLDTAGVPLAILDRDGELSPGKWGHRGGKTQLPNGGSLRLEIRGQVLTWSGATPSSEKSAVT